MTYLFNQNLMVRDDNQKLPYTRVGTLLDGSVVYVGRDLKVDEETVLLGYNGKEDRFAIHALLGTEDVFKLLDTSNERNFWIAMQTACKGSQITNLSDEHIMNWPSLTPFFQTNFQKFIGAKSTFRCGDAKKMAEARGLNELESSSMIRGLMLERHLNQPSSYKNLAITINLEKAMVWEAALDHQDETSAHRCTILQIDVPEIEEPETPIFQETT